MGEGGGPGFVLGQVLGQRECRAQLATGEFTAGTLEVSGRVTASPILIRGGTLQGSGTLAERLDSIEAMVLRETLLRHRWNKTHAAKELGLSRMGLRQKLARFGLEGQADG